MNPTVALLIGHSRAELMENSVQSYGNALLSRTYSASLRSTKLDHCNPYTGSVSITLISDCVGIIFVRVNHTASRSALCSTACARAHRLSLSC